MSFASIAVRAAVPLLVASALVGCGSGEARTDDPSTTTTAVAPMKDEPGACVAVVLPDTPNAGQVQALMKGILPDIGMIYARLDDRAVAVYNGDPPDMTTNLPTVPEAEVPDSLDELEQWLQSTAPVAATLERSPTEEDCAEDSSG